MRPQSLYALVSRVMDALRRRIGRREGVRGYMTDQMLTRIEKVSLLDFAVKKSDVYNRVIH